MFDLRNYILKLLDGSIGKEPDYKVRENALKWFERGTLVQADLDAIDQLLDARYEVEETIADENVAYDRQISENVADERQNEEDVTDIEEETNEESEE